MKNKSNRTFLIDGNEMQFNFNLFNELFMDKIRQTKEKVGNMEQILADEIFVEKSTVHTWRNCKSGPSDIEKIKAIAEYFECDYLELLIDIEEREELETMESNKLVTISDREKDSIGRIYKEMLDYVRVVELYYDAPEFTGDIMSDYYDDVEDIDCMYPYLECKIDDINRIIENELINLSKRTYMMVQKIMNTLYRLQFVGYLESFDKKDKEQSETITVMNEESEEYKEQVKKEVKIEIRKFFSQVRDLVDGFEE